MKVERIYGEHGPMSSMCKRGACPAAVVTDDGNVFVQGYQPAEAEAQILSAPEGEGFVKMPLETLRKIARQVL